MKKIFSVIMVFTIIFGAFTVAYAEEKLSGALTYNLNEDERILAEEIVMAEASTDFYGQALIAECMLNTAALNRWTIPEVVENYGWTENRVEPSESVIWAIKSVFDYGYRPSGGELITVFYNPKMVDSEYHESQEFVLEHRGVRFFRESKFNKFKKGGVNDLNKNRRSEIAQAEIMLEEVQKTVERIAFNEDMAFDNLSDNLQSSSKGKAIELAAQHLDEAAEYISMALDELEMARSGE